MGVNQPKRLEDARILIANTAMDTDKIKVCVCVCVGRRREEGEGESAYVAVWWFTVCLGEGVRGEGVRGEGGLKMSSYVSIGRYLGPKFVWTPLQR